MRLRRAARSRPATAAAPARRAHAATRLHASARSAAIRAPETCSWTPSHPIARPAATTAGRSSTGSRTASRLGATVTAVDAMACKSSHSRLRIWAQGFPWTCSDFRVIPEVPREGRWFDRAHAQNRPLSSQPRSSRSRSAVRRRAQHSAPPTVFGLASRLPALSRADGANLGGIQWASACTRRARASRWTWPSPRRIRQISRSGSTGPTSSPRCRTGPSWAARGIRRTAFRGAGDLRRKRVGLLRRRPADRHERACARLRPEEVARHEYGHHIALNRSNAPWPAFDWGPKRWATAAHICPRVRWNTAYPGDESLLYKLNPGEAFAEAYRVLVDMLLGEAHPAWPLVDPSFYPDGPLSTRSSRTSAHHGPARLADVPSAPRRLGAPRCRRRSTERSPCA